MDNPHPVLPGPRPTHDLAPPSFPPGPRRWSAQAPISQSRGGYTSPDPSPTDQPFNPPDHSLRTPNTTRDEFYQSDYFQHSRRDEERQRVSMGMPGMMGLPMVMHKRMVHPQHSHPVRAEVDPFYYPAMPQRAIAVGGAHAKKSRAVRKVDGKQPTFLTKLYQILEQPEYHHIIRWDKAGEVIIIEKPDELADKILPLVYRQSRFASFSRQLNIYGFMRKVSLRHVDRGICDPDASTWSHPLLRRASSASDIQGFKRRVPPRPSQASKRRASSASSYHDDPHHMFGLSPTSSEGSYQSPPDAYQHHLLPDLDEEKPVIFPSPPVHLMPLEVSSPESGPDISVPQYHLASRPILPSHPSFQLPATIHHPAPDMLFGRDIVNAVGGIPASAPAHMANFPAQLHRINQGHIRTRSVQGEPPSATLFSPTSPLAQEGWVPDMQSPLPTTEEPEPALKGDTNTAPTYNINDPSTWVRRGFTDLHTGAPIPNPFGDRVIQPASVPNDFAPAYVSPTTLPPDGSTISPGIYQPGFSMPLYKPAAYIASTPRAVPLRQERRASVSSSPYSPRSKAPGTLNFGTIRGFGGKDHAEGRGKSPDEALPSAGIRGLHRGPFDGVLPEAMDIADE